MAKQIAVRKTVARKPAVKPTAKKTARRPTKTDPALDLSAFPAGSVRQSNRYVCLGCLFQIFVKQLGVSPRTAYTQIRGYTPGVPELTGREPARPYFDSSEKFPRCPYCDATTGKLARFSIARLEGGRATSAARKALLDGLPKKDGQFEVLEEKASRRDLVFAWLEELGNKYDFEQTEWLRECAREYLEKRLPKTGWADIFTTARFVRRSSRIEEGWEADGNRLYLAPPLYYEVLLMQYLVSRSHRSGGVTFEGRLTLQELMRRLWRSGYLAEHALEQGDPLETLEKLVEGLDPGGATTTLHFVVDRRDFLEKTKKVYTKYAS